MKFIKITTAGTFANPIPSIPHLEAEEGEVIEIGDQLADVMVNEYKAAEYCDAPAEEEESESVDDAPEDSDPADEKVEEYGDSCVAALMEEHTKKLLQAACLQDGIDDSGSKTELATRLVENGITEIVTE